MVWTTAARPPQPLQPPGMDEVLRQLAAEQGGAFSRTQALSRGCTPAELRAFVRRGWVSPYRGVYVPRALLRTEDPARRHVTLAAARVLTSTLDPLANRRTAALVHGLPLLGRPPKVPQLVRPPRHPRDRSETSTLQVAPVPSADRVVVGGIPVTSLGRTAVDVARTSPLREAVVVADAALRRGVPREDLLATADRCASWPGGAAGLATVRCADGRADGPLESVTRMAYAAQGLPAPETQVEVWSPEGTFLGLVDFLWREQRVVGEADGLEKYDSPLALRKEKRREEGLRLCGLEVVRNVWDEVWTPAAQAALAARVRRAFALAARHPAVRGVTFRTPSLDELLLPPWQRPY
jgi:hypothetical protein